jgi:hypothetical protein
VHSTSSIVHLTETEDTAHRRPQDRTQLSSPHDPQIQRPYLLVYSTPLTITRSSNYCLQNSLWPSRVCTASIASPLHIATFQGRTLGLEAS